MAVTNKLVIRYWIRLSGDGGVVTGAVGVFLASFWKAQLICFGSKLWPGFHGCRTCPCGIPWFSIQWRSAVLSMQLYLLALASDGLAVRGFRGMIIARKYHAGYCLQASKHCPRNERVMFSWYLAQIYRILR